MTRAIEKLKLGDKVIIDNADSSFNELLGTIVNFDYTTGGLFPAYDEYGRRRKTRRYRKIRIGYWVDLREKGWRRFSFNELAIPTHAVFTPISQGEP